MNQKSIEDAARILLNSGFTLKQVNKMLKDKDSVNKVLKSESGFQMEMSGKAYPYSQ